MKFFKKTHTTKKFEKPLAKMSQNAEQKDTANKERNYKILEKQLANASQNAAQKDAENFNQSLATLMETAITIKTGM